MYKTVDSFSSYFLISLPFIFFYFLYFSFPSTRSEAVERKRLVRQLWELVIALSKLSGNDTTSETVSVSTGTWTTIENCQTSQDEGRRHWKAMGTITSVHKSPKRLQRKLLKRLGLYYEGVAWQNTILPVVCSSKGWTVMEKQFPEEEEGVEVWPISNNANCLCAGKLSN